MADFPQPQEPKIIIPPNESRLLSMHDLSLPVNDVMAPDAERVWVMQQPTMEINDSAAPNADLVPKEFPFGEGQWLPGADPLMIGERNFSLLQNLRYAKNGLETVNGYSKINGTALTTHLKGRSGIQFHKMIAGSLSSIVLVQAENTGLTESAILNNQAVVPATGNFAGNVHVDAVGAGLGRFSLAPDGNVAYCNGQESMIWAGEEHRIAAFIVTDGAAINRDYTEAVRDTLLTASHVASIFISGDNPIILIGSTRPLKGFKFYLSTPNTEAVTSSVDYWGAGGWTAVSAFVDGTLLAGKTFGQSGAMTFDSTATTAIPKYEQGYVLYFYRVTVSGQTSGGTNVYYATCDPPFQTIKDTWDGVERSPAQAQVLRDGKYFDVTLHALEAEGVSGSAIDVSTLDGPAGALLLLGFSERTQAVIIKMAAGNININAATVAVNYWNGTAWTAVANRTDGTFADSDALNRAGTIWWTPPSLASEFPQTLFGVKAFYYQLKWSAALSATVHIDQITSIPAAREMHGYKFPFQFQNRLLLMGDLVGNQGHAAEYSLANGPDVWNGEDASGGGGSLYFGEGGTLSCATEIYNRFAGSLAYLGIVCKSNETYLLSGNSPDSFAIFPISKTIGCPAPLTMATAEVAYSIAEDAQRNIAMWLSFEGPVICDASVIKPMTGIETYFDQNDTRCINTSAIENARGWYDPHKKEYNLLIPSGSGQTLCNAWLVYDLQRQRWLEKVPPAYPQAAFTVRDLFGRSYTYAMIETGHMLRLEHGFAYDGSGITQIMETADILPTGTTWEETRLRHLRFSVVRAAGTGATVPISHYGDGQVLGTLIAQPSLTDGAHRITLAYANVNRLATSHRLRFALTTTEKQVTWLLWGGVWEKTRQFMR